MAENEIVGRIKYLIRNLNYRQNEFADKIGVNASNLSKYLNGRLPLSESLVNRIVVNMGVSKQWLESGTDLPFAKQPQAPQSLEVTSEQLRTHSTGTPVYDIDVTAGTMPRTQMFADEQIVGSVNLPDVVSRDCRIVRVSGDSMCPVINNGDYLAIRELQNPSMLFWGQIYVLLLDDYRLVKYVRKHENPEMVTLRSANTNYDDMEVMRRDIREMMFVHNILHIDTRM